MAAPLMQRIDFYGRSLRESNCRGGTAKVAFALLFKFYNGQTGRCDPGQTALAREAGLCLRQVRKSITELRDAGWFRVTLGEGAETRYGRTSFYRPLFDRPGVAVVLESPSNVVEHPIAGDGVLVADSAFQGGNAHSSLEVSKGGNARAAVGDLRGERAFLQGGNARAGRTQERTLNKISRESEPSLPLPSGGVNGAAHAGAFAGESFAESSLPKVGKKAATRPAFTDEQFLAFKAAYPKRLGGQGWPKARKGLDRAASKGIEPAAIIAAAAVYASTVASKVGPEREYIKQAVTWVNGEGWADEYGAASAPISRPLSVDERRAWLDRHGLMNAGKSAVVAKLRETDDEPRWTWER
jgi:hypothetical protein